MAPFNAATIEECSKNDEEIYGHVEANTGALKRLIILTLYGAQTKKALGKIICERQKFVMEFRGVFQGSKLKAIIFEIDGSPDNVEYIRTTKALFSYIGIPHVYFKHVEQMRSAILVASNISLNVGERIVEVLIDNNGFVVSELEYTSKGYIEREQRDCKPYKRMSPGIIRQRILGTNNIVKIICHANSSEHKATKFLTKKVLNGIPEGKVLIMEESLDGHNHAFVYETVKWLFDRSYTRFYVCQKSFRDYMIRYKYGSRYYPLILCKKGDILPVDAVVTIPKSFLQYTYAYTDMNDVDVVDAEILALPENVHALKFSLSIDVSNFMEYNVSGIICKKVSRLPKQLDAKKLTIPVIGFFCELSFMYIKGEDGYKLLDSWNGDQGKDLYISFNEKKIKFFEDAVKVFICGSSSVVHDLIKIMSTSPSKCSTIRPTHGYIISSDSEHPILLDFRNSLGERKASTPSFLMALLLKEHLKELKEILGEKPKEIGICFFDDFDGDSEAKIRVQNCLKKSCELLPDLECSFIEAV